MRWRSVMSPLRTGCLPTWKATSSTASIANMVFLLSRGIPSASPQAPLGAFSRSRRHSCRSETLGSTRRPIEFADFTPHRPGMPGNNQLCNSHAATDAEWLLGKVDQDDADLSPIISIYCSRRIGHGHAILGCQARARPDLGLEAYR